MSIIDPESRCPECDRPLSRVQPDDLKVQWDRGRTVIVVPEYLRRRISATAGHLCCGAFGLLFWLLAFSPDTPGSEFFSILGFVLFCLVLLQSWQNRR